MSLFIDTLLDARKASKFAKDWQGRTRGSVRGIITDTLDPLGLGRVKVVMDSKNGGEGFKYQSDWIPVETPFIGRLPETLVGTRVNLTPTDSDMHRLVASSIIFDENSEAITPNSTMSRLPVYPSGKLPPACKENVGCMVIEEDGPYGWDWITICMGKKEDSGDKNYYWIRLPHQDHVHAGANDVPEVSTFGESSVLPGEWAENTVTWDRVLPTTDKEYPRAKYTNFGDNGRGTIANWLGPAPWEPLT